MSAFVAELLSGLPGHSDFPIHQFAPERTRTHSEGTVVRVSSEDSAWIGNFHSATYPGGVTELFKFQTRSSICVISGGQGYFVDLETPSSYQLLKAFPVLGVRYIRERDQILVWDHTKIQACSSNGPQWYSARISYDGVKISGITTGNRMTGLAWEAAGDAWVEFEIDLETGSHRGGAQVE